MYRPKSLGDHIWPFIGSGTTSAFDGMTLFSLVSLVTSGSFLIPFPSSWSSGPFLHHSWEHRKDSVLLSHVVSQGSLEHPLKTAYLSHVAISSACAPQEMWETLEFCCFSRLYPGVGAQTHLNAPGPRNIGRVLLTLISLVLGTLTNL